MLRFAYDIGSGSIGWVVYELPSGANAKNKKPKILGIGVIIFSDSRDPKDKQSLATKRREPRSQRRRRDRYLRRRQRLMNALIRYGLMPQDAQERKTLEILDPYPIRAAALEKELPPHHIGRALFHLNQRRGFKSNRKADKSDKDNKKEGVKIKEGSGRLEKAMEEGGFKTLGAYLNSRLYDETGARCRDEKHGRPAGGVRARLRGQGKDAAYDLYPLRAMIAREFDAIWAAQKKYNPSLFHDQARDFIRDILLFQRDLKPVEVGRCTFFPDEERALRALPCFQRLRIDQEVNHLKFSDNGISWRKITMEERDTVAAKLLAQGSLTWSSLRTALSLPAKTQINLDKPQRGKSLKGDETAHALRNKDRFGKDWDRLPPESQNAIVKHLLEAEDDEKVINWLMEEHQCSPEQAQAIANVNLPSGTGHLSEKAIMPLLEILETESVLEDGRACPLTYNQAVEKAFGRSHSDFDQEGNLSQLPYYGKILQRHVAFGSDDSEDLKEKYGGEEKFYGRIANPSVHVILNQLRKLVNSQIHAYGLPDEVILELARELKLNTKQKRDLEIQQKNNREANEGRRKKLAEYKPDLKPTPHNLMRLRLWEQLNPQDCKDRRCPYTGKQISMNKLFSDEIDVDHILPFSITLDDSEANRIVCYRAANRVKTNKTPYEAFSHSPYINGFQYDWSEIEERAAGLPGNKRWRFAEDAMERFNKEDDFIARQLNDTKYAARLARSYLTAVCPSKRVWVTPGRLTSLLRGKLGLNRILSRGDFKNRDDHRQHAIDAAIIGITEPGFLNIISRDASRQAVEDPDRFLRRFPEPWPGFRQDVAQAVQRMIVSHKPEHGTQGRLHEDTAYGLVTNPENEHRPDAPLVRRKLVTELSDKEIELVRDDDIRAALKTHLEEVVLGLSGGDCKKATEQALAEFSATTGIRRIRVLKLNKNYIKIHHGYNPKKGDQHKKAVLTAEYHHMDIYADAAGKWQCEAVSVFDANQQPSRPPKWRADPQNRLIMRVHKEDLIELDDKNGQRQIYRVVKLDVSAQRLSLAFHYEGGILQSRHEDKEDPFRWDFAAMSTLQKRAARKVMVDLLGGVHNCPPPQDV